MIDPGKLNPYFGPDFNNAVINFLGDLIRKGNVEIPEKCSDWYNHGHQSNAAYNGVILQSDIKMNSRNIKKYLLKEEFAGVVPGNDFINKILGNILLPLKQIDNSHDCFEGWYQLPVQPYGKFANLMKHMGYDQPLTFGLQQGLFNWIRNSAGWITAATAPIFKLIVYYKIRKRFQSNDC